MAFFLDQQKSELLSYYNTIRTTIHNFDAIRLNAAIAGLTISSALIVAALNAVHYVTSLPIPAEKIAAMNTLLGNVGWDSYLNVPTTAKIPTKYLFAAFLCAVSLTASLQFWRKIGMYSFFIGEAVRISILLEDELIGIKELKLTRCFSEHPYAASSSAKHPKPGQADKIFVRALIGIALATFLCLISFLWEAANEVFVAIS